jgi:ABC-2 type transport system ATP-binding protein
MGLKMEESSLLQLVGVSKVYKRKNAIEDISFTIMEGDALGVVGNNGAGKSTTLSVIATIMKPDSGELRYRGKDIVKHPEFIRKELGYVPQDIALYTDLTGMDNLKFWGKAYHLYGDALKRRMEAVCEIIDIDFEQLNTPVKNYSGGMKRRLNIGAALLHEPKIVVMDEPTVGLDVVSRNKILDAIKKLNSSGVTIIYTGHYIDEIKEICNKICVLDAGRLVAMETNEK